MVVTVRAAVHDVGHTVAEYSSNLTETRQAALIFGSVVKERGNGHLFIAAVLDHQRGDAQKMTDVGPFGALANLARVNARSIAERALETARKQARSGAVSDSSGSLPASRFCQQPQDFPIEPNTRNHQAEHSIPLGVPWSAPACGVLDPVEFQDEVERGDDDDDQANANAPTSATLSEV
jgi:hypothetical protein